jgi:hypothetical protein
MPLGTDETTIAPSVVHAILTDAYLYFRLDDRYHPDLVVWPGQPVNFVWEIYEFNHSGAPNPDWSAATAVIRVLGNSVWPANVARSGRIEAATLPPEFYRFDMVTALDVVVTKADGSDSRRIMQNPAGYAIGELLY